MCLDKITGKPDEKQEMIGYKVISEINYNGPYFRLDIARNKNKKPKLHVWNTDINEYDIDMTGYRTYKAGFHIYLSKYSAVSAVAYHQYFSYGKFKIYKVKIKGITAIGEQDKDRVAVGRSIQFLEELTE